MKPREEIENKLKKYPQLNVQRENETISILPSDENGFPVWFSEDEDEYTVGYGPWHEHFPKDAPEDALNCFAFGLSKSCRIKVYSRAGKEYKWIMESLEDNEWVTDSTMGTFNLVFWQKPKIKYLTNGLL